MKATQLPNTYTLKDTDYVRVLTQGQEALLPAANLLEGETLDMVAGTGITAGTGTVCVAKVDRSGDLIVTEIFIDLTGLNSKNTDGDIIGVNGTTNPCYIGQVTAALNGTIVGAKIECLETPAGGDPNINLYSATEATGVEDGAIGDLTETLLYDRSGDWAVDDTKAGFAALPAADQYLYLTQGDATGTDATYTAGKLLITLYGN